jgi:tetratricopeptide (TPR) repeat protein
LLAEQIEIIGEQQNDIATQLVGRDMHGLALCFLGQPAAARALLEQCHGLSNHRALTNTGHHYPVMLAHLATTLAYLGFIDQAKSRLNEALAEARRVGHAHTLAHVLAWATLGVTWITRSSELQGQTEELQAISTELGFSYWLARATTARARLLTSLGEAREALALFRQGLEAITAAGAVMGTPGLLVSFAEAHAALGQPAEGLNRLAEAAQIVEATEERADEAELHRVRGDLLNASGDPSEAEANYREAIAIAQRQSAKLWELCAATSLARLWRDQGKSAEARELLAPVYDWFTEGLGTRVLQEAKALLDELSADPNAGMGDDVAPAPTSGRNVMYDSA